MRFCPMCGEPRLIVDENFARAMARVTGGNVSESCYDCTHCGLGVNIYIYNPAEVPQ